MSNIYSNGSGGGNAGTGASWHGGVAPVSGDRVLIMSGDTITLDGVYEWGDDTTSTITINGVSTTHSITVQGTLIHSRSVNSSLTCVGDFYTDNNGVHDCGTEASPIPSTKTAGVILNKSGSLADGKYKYMKEEGGVMRVWGATRTRITTLASAASAAATTITINDGTGWNPGDTIYLPSTVSPVGENKEELAVIHASYTPGSTTVPLVSALSFAHVIKTPIANLTSNVNFTDYNNTYRAPMVVQIGSNTVANSVELGYATFYNPFSDDFSNIGLSFFETNNFGTTPWINPIKKVKGLACYSLTGSASLGICARAVTSQLQFDNCAVIGTGIGFSLQTVNGQGTAVFNNCMFAGNCTDNSTVGDTFNNCWFCFVTEFGTSFNGQGRNTILNDCIFSGPSYGAALAFNTTSLAGAKLNRCDIGLSFARSTDLSATQIQAISSSGDVTYTDCQFGPIAVLDTVGQLNLSGGSFVKAINKNADLTLQEEYYGTGKTLRQNITEKRSTSSLSMIPAIAGTPYTHTLSISISNGETVHLVGYCKYDAKYYNGGTGFVAPTMTLSGTINGTILTPVVYTAPSTLARTATMTIASPCVVSFTSHGFVAGDKVSFVTTGALPTGLTAGTEYFVIAGGLTTNAFEVSATYAGSAINTSGSQSGTHTALSWDLIDKSITNSTGADGSITMTYSIQSGVVTGTVFFDGIADSPMVTRARHYGFVFDEANPKRIVNTAVSANEATAAAYTGMMVTGGTTVSPVTITADNTFQKLYDYTQAWSCLNIPDAAPCQSPVAGLLIAEANVTINTGHVLNGTGSIAMGAFLLTTEFSGPHAYTFTGGTWSQNSTVPTFGAGTLNYGAEDTTVFTATDTTINMSPSANAVTYHFGGATFGGSILFHNNHATRAITVEVPSGTTYTTSTAGGTVTVTSPAITQSVTVSGFVTGSRLQIYDVTSSTELYNAVVSGTSHTWTDSSAAVATRAIRVRIAYQSTVTAKNFIDANIGTCATSGAGKDISYLASQTDDAVYVANGIDGSGVTGITIVIGPSRVVINLAGGAVTWPTIYAYQVYWQFTATGIAQEDAFISASDTANYILTAFSIKNTNANPLSITGGWGRDSVTGTIAGCVDSAGSTGNIFAEPDHVVAYATGSALTSGQAAELAAAAASAALAVTQTKGALTVPLYVALK